MRRGMANVFRQSVNSGSGRLTVSLTRNSSRAVASTTVFRIPPSPASPASMAPQLLCYRPRLTSPRVTISQSFTVNTRSRPVYWLSVTARIRTGARITRARWLSARVATPELPVPPLQMPCWETFEPIMKQTTTRLDSFVSTRSSHTLPIAGRWLAISVLNLARAITISRQLIRRPTTPQTLIPASTIPPRR